MAVLLFTLYYNLKKNMYVHIYHLKTPNKIVGYDNVEKTIQQKIFN